jgi:hypothetical protein
MDERLAAIGLGRQAPTPAPVTIARPTAVFHQLVRIRDGHRERETLCEIDPSGLRLSDERSARAIAWRDLRALELGGGRVRVVTPTDVVTMTPAIDGVSEPDLSPLFLQVLEQARAGIVDPRTGALHDLANALDRVLDGFADADDPVVPAAVGAFGAVATIILAAAVPIVAQLVARASPVAGSFVIEPRIEAYDPRSLVAAIAGAAALAAAVARFGLGGPALVWARGTLRGWHRNAFGLEERARNVIARLLLAPRVAVAVALGAVLVLLPSAFARTVVDAYGVHGASGLPLLSRDRPWSDVVDVIPIAVGIGERTEGFATTLVFSDGSRLSTRGRDLVGGSERALFDFARSHAR